jgi:D-alanyl-D-alanine carboxypeptidase/D-alanyl-D-alanine-endopeptidase (penicillin-binding protein 4)
VAAARFAQALRKAGITVAGKPRRTAADPAAQPLATVHSAPVRDVVSRVIAVSDNEGAEVLAHHVAIAEGLPATFDGGVRAVTGVLGRLGVTLRPGEVVHDGSGLSRANRLSAATLLDVLALAAADEHPDLRAALTGLPVAGFSGSLATRFDEASPAGRGRVRAKTGTLSGVHGLAGVTTDLDGDVLTFVLLADRVRLEDTLDARQVIDNAAAALGACHCASASGPPA